MRKRSYRSKALDQQIEAVKLSDVGNLADGLDAHGGIGMLEEFAQARERDTAALSDLAHVFGANVLGGGRDSEGDEEEGRTIKAHNLLSRVYL